MQPPPAPQNHHERELLRWLQLEPVLGRENLSLEFRTGIQNISITNVVVGLIVLYSDVIIILIFGVAVISRLLVFVGILPVLIALTLICVLCSGLWNNETCLKLVWKNIELKTDDISVIVDCRLSCGLFFIRADYAQVELCGVCNGGTIKLGFVSFTSADVGWVPALDQISFCAKKIEVRVNDSENLSSTDRCSFSCIFQEISFLSYGVVARVWNTPGDKLQCILLCERICTDLDVWESACDELMTYSIMERTGSSASICAEYASDIFSVKMGRLMLLIPPVGHALKVVDTVLLSMEFLPSFSWPLPPELFLFSGNVVFSMEPTTVTVVPFPPFRVHFMPRSTFSLSTDVDACQKRSRKGSSRSVRTPVVRLLHPQPGMLPNEFSSAAPRTKYERNCSPIVSETFETGSPGSLPLVALAAAVICFKITSGELRLLVTSPENYSSTVNISWSASLFVGTVIPDVFPKLKLRPYELSGSNFMRAVSEMAKNTVVSRSPGILKVLKAAAGDRTQFFMSPVTMSPVGGSFVCHSDMSPGSSRLSVVAFVESAVLGLSLTGLMCLWANVRNCTIHPSLLEAFEARSPAPINSALRLSFSVRRLKVFFAEAFDSKTALAICCGAAVTAETHFDLRKSIIFEFERSDIASSDNASPFAQIEFISVAFYDKLERLDADGSIQRVSVLSSKAPELDQLLKLCQLITGSSSQSANAHPIQILGPTVRKGSRLCGNWGTPYRKLLLSWEDIMPTTGLEGVDCMDCQSLLALSWLTDSNTVKVSNFYPSAISIETGPTDPACLRPECSGIEVPPLSDCCLLNTSLKDIKVRVGQALVALSNKGDRSTLDVRSRIVITNGLTEQLILKSSHDSFNLPPLQSLDVLPGPFTIEFIQDGSEFVSQNILPLLSDPTTFSQGGLITLLGNGCLFLALQVDSWSADQTKVTLHAPLKIQNSLPWSVEALVMDSVGNVKECRIENNVCFTQFNPLSEPLCLKISRLSLYPENSSSDLIPILPGSRNYFLQGSHGSQVCITIINCGDRMEITLSCYLVCVNLTPQPINVTFSNSNMGVLDFGKPTTLAAYNVDDYQFNVMQIDRVAVEKAVRCMVENSLNDSTTVCGRAEFVTFSDNENLGNNLPVSVDDCSPFKREIVSKEQILIRRIQWARGEKHFLVLAALPVAIIVNDLRAIHVACSAGDNVIAPARRGTVHSAPADRETNIGLICPHCSPQSGHKLWLSSIDFWECCQTLITVPLPCSVRSRNGISESLCLTVSVQIQDVEGMMLIILQEVFTEHLDWIKVPRSLQDQGTPPLIIVNNLALPVLIPIPALETAFFVAGGSILTFGQNIPFARQILFRLPACITYTDKNERKIKVENWGDERLSPLLRPDTAYSFLNDEIKFLVYEYHSTHHRPRGRKISSDVNKTMMPSETIESPPGDHVVGSAVLMCSVKCSVIGNTLVANFLGEAPVRSLGSQLMSAVSNVYSHSMNRCETQGTTRTTTELSHIMIESSTATFARLKWRKFGLSISCRDARLVHAFQNIPHQLVVAAALQKLHIDLSADKLICQCIYRVNCTVQVEGFNLSTESTDSIVNREFVHLEKPSEFSVTRFLYTASKCPDVTETIEGFLIDRGPLVEFASISLPLLNICIPKSISATLFDLSSFRYFLPEQLRTFLSLRSPLQSLYIGRLVIADMKLRMSVEGVVGPISVENSDWIWPESQFQEIRSEHELYKRVILTHFVENILAQWHKVPLSLNIFQKPFQFLNRILNPRVESESCNLQTIIRNAVEIFFGT